MNLLYCTGAPHNNVRLKPSDPVIRSLFVASPKIETIHLITVLEDRTGTVIARIEVITMEIFGQITAAFWYGLWMVGMF